MGLYIPVALAGYVSLPGFVCVCSAGSCEDSISEGAAI